MKVRDVMTESVNFATPNNTVVELAQKMKNDDIGSIPICEGRKVVGIITDRDIVIKAVSQGKNIETKKANEIMNSNVITVTADQDVHEAADLMSKHQIRRLPVVEQDKLIGIVALGDLAVEKIHINEAGDALSDISKGVRH